MILKSSLASLPRRNGFEILFLFLYHIPNNLLTLLDVNT